MQYCYHSHVCTVLLIFGEGRAGSWYDVSQNRLEFTVWVVLAFFGPYMSSSKTHNIIPCIAVHCGGIGIYLIQYVVKS